MKLNWFSPLPPARTDIAHYTKRLLPALANVADITLWTEQRTWDRELERFATVRRYSVTKMPWLELNHADMTVYQIGNDHRFHRSIWQVSRQLAGIVVLHDYRLHHFFDMLFRVDLRDPNSYFSMMHRYYGERGRNDAVNNYRNNSRDIDHMADRYPLTQAVLENALAVIVHTTVAFDSVANLSELPIACVPLPFPARNSEQSQPRRPNTEGRRRLVLFGYIGRNRRLDSILQALSQTELKERFHLDIFGIILNDENNLRSQIRALNLGGVVNLRGFKPESELDKALSEADLAINLRYPTMGEASGSQLRIWAHSLPSLVSKVGWYASLPEDAVAFVRTDENEIEDIKKHLTAFLNEPKRFVAMGERGQIELERTHSPAGYASALRDMVTHAQRFRPIAANLALAERAGSIVGQWLNAHDPGVAFQRVAQEIYLLAKRS